MPVEASQVVSARAAEAAGEATISFEFRGHTVTIPRALEAWPLDEIRSERYGRSLRILVGEPAIRAMRLRTRGDLIELSHRCADACGVTPLPDDDTAPPWFGAVTTLLRIVDNHADDLEADLLRFYRVDYRRPPPAGPTLRQVWVYVRRIQPTSAIMAARNKGEQPWTRAELIAAQNIEMWTRKRYPGRPATRDEYEKWMERIANDQRTMSKLEQREAYYASGQNMRDAGADPGPRPPQPPKQPPQPRETPAQHALAVAMKNARRTPKGATNGRPPAGQPGAPGRPKRYEPGDSGWG